MVKSSGRKRLRPIPIPTFQSPCIPKERQLAESGTKRPSESAIDVFDESSQKQRTTATARAAVATMNQNANRRRRKLEMEDEGERGRQIVRSCLQPAQEMKAAVTKTMTYEVVANLAQGTHCEQQRPKPLKRSFSLQQKKKEYYTQRELLAMNSETPPKLEEEAVASNNSSPTGSDQLNNKLIRREQIKDDVALKDIPPLPSGEWTRTCPEIVLTHRSPPATTSSHASALSSVGSPNVRDIGTFHSPQSQQLYRFCFVEKGRDMHPAILVGPKETARHRGAQVLDTFNPTNPPTHFIVSSNPISVECIALELGFSTVESLREYVHQHRILCCTRAWVTSSPQRPYTEVPPSLANNHIYRPLFSGSVTPNRMTKAKKTKKESNGNNAQTPSTEIPKRNLGVSRMLEQLSQLYQEAPLDSVDLWRSYSFQMIAGRVQHLDFDLTTDNLNQLKRIKGVGNSILDVVKEYLEHVEAEGENDCGDGMSLCDVQRLKNVKNDPQRKALRQMCQIWGVGRVTGMELVRAGYQTVVEVRRDFDSGKLSGLSRNQCIGLLCYDDLLLKMDETEVESIFYIVKRAVTNRFANAKVELLGSYRRRKGSYGDVDVLISHPKYVTSVPPKALGKIVQDLRRSGHIAYHLTCTHGMDTGEFDESVPNSVLGKITTDRKTGSPSTSTMTSYMGIFASHTTTKLRRIDIKFYPSRERIFALLYFTGNGHFNRSMRLWSLRKFGWTLNDHGLFERETNIRVMDSPRTEQELFQKLQLEWREPHERLCFDSVMSTADQYQLASSLDGFSDREFQQEAKHRWIE